jgi:LysM repeat protein
MSLDEIYAYNGVWLEFYGNRWEIKSGDNVLIPGRNGETLIERGSYYRFKSGDNLFRIGQRTGYSMAELTVANPEAWDNPNQIRTGTLIYIPASRAEIPTPSGVAPQTPPTPDDSQACTYTTTPYYSRIVPGDEVRVVSLGPNTAPNLVYDPLGTSGNRTLVGSLAAGETAIVVDGPRCDDDMIWWYVVGTRVSGWTSEGRFEESQLVYWLEPLPWYGTESTQVKEITLRPSCETTIEVERGTEVVLMTAWGVKGEALAREHDAIMDVEIRLDGEGLESYRTSLRSMTEIPCGSPLGADTYWVTEVANVFRDRGQYSIDVIYYFPRRITDGFDLDRDGYLDMYGPGFLESRTYTLIVR